MTKTHNHYNNLPLDPDVVTPGSFGWPPHFTFVLQVVVFVGGSLGALARYLLGNLLPAANNEWPIATFVINLAGAFMLGFLLEALSRRGEDKGALRIVRLGVGTGFLGAFTTYSTFAVEVTFLTREAQPMMAFAYAIASIIGGVLLNVTGIILADRRTKRNKVLAV